MLFQIGGFERDKVKSIFIEKCRYKKIEPSYDLFFEKTKLDEARDLREEIEFLRGI